MACPTRKDATAEATPRRRRALARGCRRAAAGRESGHTLVELLVVVALLSVVLAAVLSLGEATQRIAPKEQERALVIREGQIGLHSMTKDLRRAHVVNSRGPFHMDVNVVLGGANTRIRYECDRPHPRESTYRRCLRYVNGAATGQLVIDRVLNAADSPPDPVFTYTTDASGKVTHVEARIELPARGDLKRGYEHRITFTDGFLPRNLGA
jgi:prepilin-type N-terminal cleavage/methylation domain-containing protein